MLQIRKTVRNFRHRRNENYVRFHNIAESFLTKFFIQNPGYEVLPTPQELSGFRNPDYKDVSEIYFYKGMEHGVEAMVHVWSNFPYRRIYKKRTEDDEYLFEQEPPTMNYFNEHQYEFEVVPSSEIIIHESDSRAYNIHWEMVELNQVYLADTNFGNNQYKDNIFYKRKFINDQNHLSMAIPLQVKNHHVFNDPSLVAKINSYLPQKEPRLDPDGLIMNTIEGFKTHIQENKLHHDFYEKIDTVLFNLDKTIRDNMVKNEMKIEPPEFLTQVIDEFLVELKNELTNNKNVYFIEKTIQQDLEDQGLELTGGYKRKVGKKSKRKVGKRKVLKKSKRRNK